jgi:hypothetical protein
LTRYVALGKVPSPEICDFCSLVTYSPPKCTKWELIFMICSSQAGFNDLGIKLSDKFVRRKIYSLATLGNIK